jgi:hypothetical protein
MKHTAAARASRVLGLRLRRMCDVDVDDDDKLA